LQETHDVECGFVCGETPARERDELLTRFRGLSNGSLFPSKPLKFLCNVNVLTTGFDAPNIDCIALLRPTASAGLYSQICGRGFRIHPGKESCLVLDYGGNILRHGPVDRVKVPDSKGDGGEAPAKECPECHSVIAAGYAICPDCGFEFPPPERQKHDASAAEAGILSGEVTLTKHAVKDVYYSVHTKRGADDDAPKSMRVDYDVGLYDYQSEWICFEHSGYARQKAVTWWRERSPNSVPDTAEQAVEIANAGGLATPTAITVRSVAGEQFDRIIDYGLDPYSEPVLVETMDHYEQNSDDLIPF